MGLDTLEYLIDKCTFPWLLSNVLDAHTHKPLGGAKESRVVVIGGIKVGLIGLAEKEWVKSLAYINYDDMIYESFIHEAAKLAKELRKRDVRLISVRNYFDFFVINPLIFLHFLNSEKRGINMRLFGQDSGACHFGD